MISEKLQNAINEQISAEMWSLICICLCLSILKEKVSAVLHTG